MEIILRKFALIYILFILSCDPAGSSFSPNPDPIIPAEINVGTEMFVFSMNDIDFEVFYHVPATYNASSKVVFALHGGSSCLLYTSPSPRDKRQSRMPSSA